MKKMMKRTAAVTLAGIMSVGMLTGCGSKTIDGTKTVATVDGTEIPLGVVSLYARQQQEQTTAMYMSYMGSADNIWDQTADEDSGKTYGDQAVESSLKSVETMYILKEKAADYKVEVTEDEEKAIADADYDTIMYTLSGVDKWYDENIADISSSEFVFNLASHQKNMQLIKEILSSLKAEECVPTTNTGIDIPKTDTVIFISHKSDDKKYGDALERFITGLGVKDNQLVYTSHPLHKIPLDASIYEYLRSHFNSTLFMIILWSDKYLESPACLNEMGAAWVTQTDYTNIYVPSFSFGNPKYHECAVDTKKMGAVLNGDEHCKASMIELKNKIGRAHV